MSDTIFLISILTFALAGGILIGIIIGSGLTYNGMMKEAYDRGHAVQCLGKEGYYWECEE